MKFAALLLVILNAALLVPAATPYLPYIVFTSIFIAILMLALAIATAPLPDLPLPVAETLNPTPLPATLQADPKAEVIMLMRIFQEKGRLVDFLMEDITPYSDADVGSVVRSVHQGCKAAMNEHFKIEAISPHGEGASVTVPAGYAVDEFRLVGNLSGEAPFTGKVVHKGWRATSVKLPPVLNADKERLPVIAPAQVEI